VLFDERRGGRLVVHRDGRRLHSDVGELRATLAIAKVSRGTLDLREALRGSFGVIPYRGA
jgi:hypothetical protein